MAPKYDARDEIEDDKEMREELRDYEPISEPYPDDWDPNADDDYDLYTCAHGVVEWEDVCHVPCFTCKHKCIEHWGGKACSEPGCECQSFDARTNIDLMASSIEEVPDNVNKKD